MAFTLDQVVPWGRSFDEYRRMFALSENDLARRILSCGDGPASFNGEGRRRGVTVTSCDPLYQFDAGQIRQRIAATRAQILAQTRANRDQFVWTSIESVEELSRIRLAAMNVFLEDFVSHRGRYVAAALPHLPFRERSFDLAVCSHFLFLYSMHFGEREHHHALREMCRVADEVRVFPLLALDGGLSPFVEPLVRALQHEHCTVSIETVPYEFQRGGNQMLRLRRAGEPSDRDAELRRTANDWRERG